MYGPAGTKAMMENLEKAYDWDIQTRIADQALSREDLTPIVTEINEGVVYERDGVKVTAFDVDHGDLIKPAFGYRVDFDGRSVVISGDTKFSENLISKAKGADLLIHQVAAAQEGLLSESKAMQLILAHHTKPEEAGTVFSRVKPKLAVYYHFALQGNAKYPAPTEEDVVVATRKTYSGPLLIGEDLMVLIIGNGAVTLRQ